MVKGGIKNTKATTTRPRGRMSKGQRVRARKEALSANLVWLGGGREDREAKLITTGAGGTESGVKSQGQEQEEEGGAISHGQGCYSAKKRED